MTTSATIASSIALRLRYLAGCLHSLGPRPLFEMMCEFGHSSAAIARFETYAAIDPDTLDQFGGRDLPTLRRVK
jgi:hypothetical protein